MAAGERKAATVGERRYVKITSLPLAGECKVSVRLANRPTRVTLQPQDQPLENWEYADGRLEVGVPSFRGHQMIVLE